MKEYKEICKISTATSILSFDQQVNMPSNGSEYRAEVLETLSLIVAKKLKSKEFLSLLQKAKEDYSDADKTIILNDIEESVKFSNRIPLKLHGKLSKLSSKCNSEWEKVKTKTAKSDKVYLKTLGQLVATIKESSEKTDSGKEQRNVQG
jgi:carboxypeptidase Taq